MLSGPRAGTPFAHPNTDLVRPDSGTPRRLPGSGHARALARLLLTHIQTSLHSTRVVQMLPLQ